MKILKKKNEYNKTNREKSKTLYNQNILINI